MEVMKPKADQRDEYLVSHLGQHGNACCILWVSLVVDVMLLLASKKTYRGGRLLTFQCQHSRLRVQQVRVWVPASFLTAYNMEDLSVLVRVGLLEQGC